MGRWGRRGQLARKVHRVLRARQGLRVPRGRKEFPGRLVRWERLVQLALQVQRVHKVCKVFLDLKVHQVRKDRLVRRESQAR